jgi:hypothetical protein
MKFIDNIMKFFGFGKSDAKGIIVLKRRPGAPRPQQPQTTGRVIVDKTIEYILNDPTTPNLILNVPVPKFSPAPKFSVQKYQGGGFPSGSFESQAANCVVTLSHTIEFLNKYTDKPIVNWAGTPMLSVFPRAGKDLNAYYDRKNLKFFYFTHERIGTMYTCDSTDIVAHELGHAILDFYRPDMWSAVFLEVAAFHEAFGDFVSMMKSLSHDEVSNYAISQTGGDFKKENVISNLAEQMGEVIFKIYGPENGRNPNCLRCAINNFKYVNPGTLPENAPDSQLAAECHSFSRIFVGAFYDIFVMMYNDIKSTGVSEIESIHQSRDTLLRYVMKAIQFAPLNVKFFESMSRTILWTDVTLNNRKYHDRIQQIFFNRNLLTPQIRMLSAPSCDNEDGIVSIQSTRSIKLGEHLIRIQSEADNPLYDVDVEIPQNQAHLYDNEKNLLDSIMVSEDESLSGAQDMISYLHKTESVSNDPMTPFEIQDGKLIRTHFI